MGANIFEDFESPSKKFPAMMAKYRYETFKTPI